MNKKQINNYLDDLKEKLINDSKKIKVTLSKEWTKQFPNRRGVYIMWERNKICYAGETGSIQGRMQDLLNTRQHVMRRNIGVVNFNKVKGFEKATSRKKFPEHIEEMVSRWVTNKIKISYLTAELGRKELEEMILDYIKPKYNVRGRRSAG